MKKRNELERYYTTPGETERERARESREKREEDDRNFLAWKLALEQNEKGKWKCGEICAACHRLLTAAVVSAIFIISGSPLN